MDPLTMISAGVGILGMIKSFANGQNANSKLSSYLKQDTAYEPSPYAGQRMGLATTLLNARMPGAATLQRNIYGNQANQLASVDRNATSGSQALAMGAAAQGQTNQSLQNLSVQEQQDYYNRLANLTGAQQGQIQEGDKAYQDRVRRFGDQGAVLGAQIKNTQTNYNNLASMGIGGAGVFSQLGNILKRPGGGTGLNNQSGMSNQNMAPDGYSNPQYADPGTNYGAAATNTNTPGWINPYQMSGTGAYQTQWMGDPNPY